MIEFNEDKFPHKYAKNWTFKDMSLCTYVWKLLGTMVLWWVGVAVGSALAFAVVHSYVLLALIPFTDLTFHGVLSSDHVFSGNLFIVMTLSTVGLLYGILYLLTQAIRGLFKKATRTTQEKEPSIIREYYRSFKDKFCPNIVVTKKEQS